MSSYRIKMLKFGIIVSVMFASCPSWAKESVTWMMMDVPPYYIREGEQTGHGIMDEIVQMLRIALPEYDHQMGQSPANLIRLVEEIKSEEHACYAGFAKTPERESAIAFSSLPVAMLLPIKLAIKREKWEQFQHVDTLSLATLLENNKLQAGITAGRSYGAAIDALLKRYIGQSHLTMRTALDAYAGLLKMLMADRVDYILGFPTETLYFTKQLGVEQDVVTIQIQENAQDEATFLYVGCSKNIWGNQIITRIDQILQQERPKDEYRQILERWIDENSLPYFRKMYETIFLSPVK